MDNIKKWFTYYRLLVMRQYLIWRGADPNKLLVPQRPDAADNT